MKISIGIIAKVQDQLVADAIERLLRNYEGCQVIYFTRDEKNNLYVVARDSYDRFCREGQ